ncbi:MAG: hypothetical protein L0Y71_20615 [Gemmataceae bacterium]|nr:hypothetical protein [Gemmataceae bacterium]
MRILYGVHGYGRGHATRTLAVLPHLAARHQILVLTGGDAYETISPDWPCVPIPTLGFVYSRGSGQRERSNWHTLRRNLPALLDLKWGGPTLDLVCQVARDFGPDVIISDAETWTHHAGAALGIPRISFDHIGILAYCRPPVAWSDALEAHFDGWCYRQLMGQPQRVLISSFYPAEPRCSGVHVVGALPRQAVRELVPSTGDYLLAYFNRGADQLHPALLDALDGVGCPVRVYGSPRRGRQGRLTFLPPSNVPFLEDLAGCRAVVSTAGNQLVGEAIFLGKPMLVVPERCVEQRMNARAVERLRIGMCAAPRRVTAQRLRAFLDKADVFAAKLRQCVSDGLNDALAALDQFLHELGGNGAAQAQARPSDAARDNTTGSASGTSANVPGGALRDPEATGCVG